MRPGFIAISVLFGCGIEGRGEPDRVVDTEGECGELGCSSGLRISLVPRSGVFEAGDYELHIGADGRGFVCRFRAESAVEGLPEGCGGDPPFIAEDECSVEASFSALPHSVAFHSDGGSGRSRRWSTSA